MTRTRRVIPWVWTGLIGSAGVVMLVTGTSPADNPDLPFAVVAVVAVTSLLHSVQ